MGIGASFPDQEMMSQVTKERKKRRNRGTGNTSFLSFLRNLSPAGLRGSYLPYFSGASLPTS